MKNAAPLGRGCVVPKAGHNSGSTPEDCRFPVMTCVPAKDAGTVVISAPSAAHAGAADKTATQTADTSCQMLNWKCAPPVCCLARHCCVSFGCLACSLLPQATQRTHASIAQARWLLVPLSSGQSRSWCRYLLLHHLLCSMSPAGIAGSPHPRAQGSTLRTQKQRHAAQQELRASTGQLEHKSQDATVHLDLQEGM